MELIRAGFDTGILVAGLLRPQLTVERSLCPLVIETARSRKYRVLILDRVVFEFGQIARREGIEREAEDRLLDFMEESQAELGVPASSEELSRH